MPITSEHVGRSYPPAPPYRVTKEKIAEFARALGDDNPAYAGDEAIAPPTFPIVFSSWDALLRDEELELRLNRMVHVEQKFTYRRALRAGDEVIAQLSIAKVRVRGAVDMITVDTALSCDGDEVGTFSATLFHNREEAS